MTSPISDSTPPADNSAPVAPQSTPPAVGGGGGGGGASSFRNLADLQQKAPKVYNEMMIGIGTTICHEQNDSNARIKAANQEFRSE